MGKTVRGQQRKCARFKKVRQKGGGFVRRCAEYRPVRKSSSTQRRRKW